MNKEPPSNPAVSEPANLRHLVITVHGIRTYGDWQERLEKILKAESKGSIEVWNYHYGYFSIIGFILPPARWLVTRKFRSRLLELCGDKVWDRVDLVGHSFGTHMIGWGLLGIKSDSRPKINTIIFAGSVLKPSFPWSKLFPSHVDRVVNDCGTRDWVLALNQIIVLFTGMAGRIGFIAMEGERFRNRYHALGHGGYFLDRDGIPNDEFMRQNWIPLLTINDAIQPRDERKRLTAIGGLREFILRNCEPIKIGTYLLITFLVIGWIYALNENAQRGKEAITKDKEFAMFSKHISSAARQAFMPYSAESPTHDAILTWGDYGNVSLWLVNDEKLGPKVSDMTVQKDISLAARIAHDDNENGTDQSSFSASMTEELGGKLINGLSGKVSKAQFSHNGKFVAICDAVGTVLLVGVPNEELISKLT